jgi:hypothetical protein
VTDLFNPVVDPLTGRRLIIGLLSFGEDSFGPLLRLAGLVPQKRYSLGALHHLGIDCNTYLRLVE